ncbi:MAG TPA: DUF3303 family protein [Actinomycetota bacterium]|nr:DUF3303 family protein [Actinomycetota bacterium]
MLHMVVQTHSPTDCAFRGKAEEELLSGAFDVFTEKPGNDVEVRGSWVNRSTHEVFVLAEAPNAHAIETAMLEAGLVGRTHSRILPVVAVADALDVSTPGR